jgi:hypothetical protein
MRRALVVSAVLAIAVAFSLATASASSSTVNLLTPTTGTIAFSQSGGSPEMVITTLTGSAAGTGVLAGATSYTLSSGSPLVFTASGPHDYATTGTLSFELNGGSFLTGTLSGISLEQIGRLVILTATLTVSGGSSGLSGAQVAIIIDLPSGTSLSGLTGVEFGGFSVGEGLGSVTPEPSTMLLFGSGLLVFAGFCRRKSTQS